jgi:hypothetical protein
VFKEAKFQANFAAAAHRKPAIQMKRIQQVLRKSLDPSAATTSSCRR